MIKRFFLFCLFASSSFAYYDFGVVGNTYFIEEPNAMEEMKKAYEKIDKEALKKEWEKKAQETLIGNIHLPFCQENSSKKTNLSNRVAPSDIDIPEADIHIKAGTPLFSFYKNINLRYILINATSIDEFNWLEKQKPSNVIISEGDLHDLRKYDQKFILNKTLQDAFDLKCTPSVFEIRNGDLIVHEYKIKREEQEKGDKK